MNEQIKQKEETELSEDMELVSPGQMLSEARQKLGLSCEEVSDKLNFRTNLVKNIENDIFDKSLPATFNRGYLRNYARLVKISAEDVVSSYEALNVAELHGAELQSFSKETEKQAANNRLMWLSYLILALVIGSTIMWWMQNKHIVNNSQSPQKIESQKVTESVKSAIENETVKERSGLENTLLEDTSSDFLASNNTIENQEVNNKTAEIVDVVEANDNVLTEDVTNVDANTTGTTSIAEQDLSVDDSLTQPEDTSERKLTPSELEDAPAPEYNELNDVIQTEVTFAFNGDCWVNIYDNSGERIAWGIKRAGYEMNILGQAPFTVTLGKPELVSIVFDGQELDMGQFRAGNIAKFTLPITP